MERRAHERADRGESAVSDRVVERSAVEGEGVGERNAEVLGRFFTGVKYIVLGGRAAECC